MYWKSTSTPLPPLPSSPSMTSYSGKFSRLSGHNWKSASTLSLPGKISMRLIYRLWDMEKFKPLAYICIFGTRPTENARTDSREHSMSKRKEKSSRLLWSSSTPHSNLESHTRGALSAFSLVTHATRFPVLSTYRPTEKRYLVEASRWLPVL